MNSNGGVTKSVKLIALAENPARAIYLEALHRGKDSLGAQPTGNINGGSLGVKQGRRSMSLGLMILKKEATMAKTERGLKKVHVPAHTRKTGVKVGEHYRSTPNQKPPSKKS